MHHFAGICTTLVLALPVHAQLAPPNALGVSFGHVHLSVADAAFHERLWAELFGAVVAERAGYAAVRLPGALVFFTERQPTAPSTETPVDHVGIAVRDLDAVLSTWRALGYEVDEESEGMGGTATAYITMPDGVRVELREHEELSVAAAMDHVHFVTPLEEELAAWYADAFGARGSSGEGVVLEAAVPGSRLSFSATREERSRTHGTAIDHIGFEVEDIDAFAERLARRGVTLETEPFYVESLDLWVLFFTDASGVRVEVTEGLDRY